LLSLTHTFSPTMREHEHSRFVLGYLPLVAGRIK
jgi:hypothetical protein